MNVNELVEDMATDDAYIIDGIMKRKYQDTIKYSIFTLRSDENYCAVHINILNLPMITLDEQDASYVGKRFSIELLFNVLINIDELKSRDI